MRSMTGFGIGEASLRHGRIVAELRSVNHRFLDVRVHAPRELADLTGLAEHAVRELFRRGRIDLSLRVEGAILPPPVIDIERARAAMRALAKLRDELAPGADLPLSLLSVVPDLLVPPVGEEIEALRTALRLAIDRAAAALHEMREKEGEALRLDLAGRVEILRDLCRQVAARAPELVEATRRKLALRVERLLNGTEAAVDPSRVEIEVALLAERGDVTEEITRLTSHLAQLGDLLASSDAIGRRLDFLLQEMVREANTVGAKSQDAGIARAVVEMKAELERFREQVQNVE